MLGKYITEKKIKGLEHSISLIQERNVSLQALLLSCTYLYYFFLFFGKSMLIQYMVFQSFSLLHVFSTDVKQIILNTTTYIYMLSFSIKY